EPDARLAIGVLARLALALRPAVRAALARDELEAAHRLVAGGLHRAAPEAGEAHLEAAAVEAGGAQAPATGLDVVEDRGRVGVDGVRLGRNPQRQAPAAPDRARGRADLLRRPECPDAERQRQARVGAGQLRPGHPLARVRVPPDVRLAGGRPLAATPGARLTAEAPAAGVDAGEEG